MNGPVDNGVKTVNATKPVPDEQETALAGIRTKLHRANSQLDSLYNDMTAFGSDLKPYDIGDPEGRRSIPAGVTTAKPKLWATSSSHSRPHWAIAL